MKEKENPPGFASGGFPGDNKKVYWKCRVSPG
jgi:hypothetical protein